MQKALTTAFAQALQDFIYRYHLTHQQSIHRETSFGSTPSASHPYILDLSKKLLSESLFELSDNPCHFQLFNARYYQEFRFLHFISKGFTDIFLNHLWSLVCTGKLLPQQYSQECNLQAEGYHVCKKNSITGPNKSII